MSVTIKQIAKELNIAPSTVSKALNNRPGVNKSLRAAIKKTVKRMGYAPYIIARETGMYDTRLKTIAIIYTRIGRHLVDKLQKGTDKVFYKNGYYELRYTIDVGNLLISEDIESQLIFQRILSDKRISGILFAFIHVSDVLLCQFHKKGIPTVILNSYTDYGKCVTINNYNAMYQLITELIKLGHKKIGLIMPSEASEHIWQDRFQGYKDALKYHHIIYDAEFYIHEYTFKLSESVFATKQLVKNHPEITAIVYGNDIQAYGGLKAFREINKKVPDDIAVVGFDDMEFNQVVIPSLSSVEQPIEEMGEIGAKMLINAIKNKNYSHEAVELETKLHLRKSCLKDYKDPS